MEATFYDTQSDQMIEVEIYETGEKTRVTANKEILSKKNYIDRTIIITAAEYENFKTVLLNQNT